MFQIFATFQTLSGFIVVDNNNNTAAEGGSFHCRGCDSSPRILMLHSGDCHSSPRRTMLLPGMIIPLWLQSCLFPNSCHTLSDHHLTLEMTLQSHDTSATLRDRPSSLLVVTKHLFPESLIPQQGLSVYSQRSDFSPGDYNSTQEAVILVPEHLHHSQRLSFHSEVTHMDCYSILGLSFQGPSFQSGGCHSSPRVMYIGYHSIHLCPKTVYMVPEPSFFSGGCNSKARTLMEHAGTVIPGSEQFFQCQGCSFHSGGCHFQTQRNVCCLSYGLLWGLTGNLCAAQLRNLALL